MTNTDANSDAQFIFDEECISKINWASLAVKQLWMQSVFEMIFEIESNKIKFKMIASKW